MSNINLKRQAVKNKLQLNPVYRVVQKFGIMLITFLFIFFAKSGISFIKKAFINIKINFLSEQSSDVVFII